MRDNDNKHELSKVSTWDINKARTWWMLDGAYDVHCTATFITNMENGTMDFNAEQLLNKSCVRLVEFIAFGWSIMLLIVVAHCARLVEQVGCDPMDLDDGLQPATPKSVGGVMVKGPGFSSPAHVDKPSTIVNVPTPTNENVNYGKDYWDNIDIPALPEFTQQDQPEVRYCMLCDVEFDGDWQKVCLYVY